MRAHRAERPLGLALAALLAVGCRSSPEQRGPWPALLAQNDAESQLAVEAAVTELLGAPVMLADDAFASRDAIAVAPQQPRDSAGHALVGRVYGRPQTIRLLKDGADCVLEHADSGRRVVLQGIECRALPSV